LNTDCIEKGAWDKIKHAHFIEESIDSSFVGGLMTIKTKPFKTEILYFSESPEELIAVSVDHYSVRYVNNPNISSHVLDGVSSESSHQGKDRIVNRVQKLFLKYQCPEGTNNSK
tara:strand:- start:9279 stop:9620 length:342 start_codon:yes stop_codon:yes gene_type:complete